VADFDVWHNARAVLDNGTVLEIDNLHTVTGVTHISRGLANMEEEGFAGMSGFPPAEAHVYLAAKMVSGAGLFTWENANADSLGVALSPGQTFELASWKSFDVSVTAGDGTVTETGLDVDVATAGRGAKFEYMILCDTRCPCCQIFFPEGCQYFTFDYDDDPDQGLFIQRTSTTVGETEYFTVIEPDGNVVPTLNDDSGYIIAEGSVKPGSYCVYASDSVGNPVAGAFYSIQMGTDFGELHLSSLDSSNLDTMVEWQPTGVRFSEPPAIDQMVNLERLQLQGVEFSPGAVPSVSGFPGIQYFAIVDSNLTTSEVNTLLVQASATFTATSGLIELQDQTPAAPPSGAGLTAKAELEGRSPGWTIYVDP
jgi:hypothetical protein